MAQQVFQQYFHRIGQSGNAVETVFFGRFQAVIDIALIADFQGSA